MSELRVSDAEREAVVTRLHRAAADGRLEPDELEERVAAAFAARTQADLLPLTLDLPEPLAPRPRASARALPEPLRRGLAGALTADVVSVAVWLGTGAHGSFWPGWVILATALGIVGPAIRGALGVEREPRLRRGRRD